MSLPENGIDELAGRIRNAGLTAPAVFFLELYKPLFGLASAAGLVAEPLITALAGAESSRKLREALASRDNIEKLLTRLEGGQAG